MSGLEVIGVVLGLWPIIATLTKQYKDLRGADSRDLNRDVKIASMIYRDLIKNILLSALTTQQVKSLMASNGTDNEILWGDPETQEKLRNRLNDKFDVTIQCLNDMEVLLNQVKTELEDLCRDKDGVDRVLAKVKTMRAAADSSPVRGKLKKIKNLNKSLGLLLNEQPMMIPCQQHESQDGTAIVSAFRINGAKAGQFFEAIKNRYICACQRPHVVGVGCYCSTCAEPFSDQLTVHSEWDFRLACRASQDVQEPPTKAPTTVLLESVPESDSDTAAIRNLCSLVQEVALEETVRNVLIDAENSRMYMKVTKIGSGGKDPAIQKLADIRQQGSGLTTKDRRELALRLCLAILRLCDTPWVSESWTWNVCVGQVAGEDKEGPSSGSDKLIKYPVIFREVYSVDYHADSSSIKTAVAPSLLADLFPDEEPILTKLGLALIELALGTSLEDMKKTEWGEVDSPDSLILGDQADRFMANKLLRTGKIRNEATVAYENAVRVCINREFTDRFGNPSRLVSKHVTFLERFRDTVLMPLLEVWKRYEM